MEKQNALQSFIQVVILNVTPLLDKSLQILLSLVVYCIIYLDIVTFFLFIWAFLLDKSEQCNCK